MKNNTTSANFEIKSVQIIKIEGTKFIFDYDKLKEIIDLNEECKNIPICVVIINGALRTGKSFFSNFIIRYLMRIENDKYTNKYIDNDNVDEMLTDYFISRRGSNIQTLGIWILNKIFIYEGKGIVLMDTQGIFDHELNQAMTIALICISCLCSSYQIYNLDKRIQEDHLCNMAYFSAYSNLIANIDDIKIGQTLCLLVRDWQNFENNFDTEKCDIETENYRKEFLLPTTDMDDVKRETREKIFQTYDNVVVRLCPHPGHLVTENLFSGKLNDVREDFKIHVDNFIKKMLDDIQPKRISNHQILLCSELPKYIKEYITLYENTQGVLPEPRTILEITEKICQNNAKEKTVNQYKLRMTKRLKARAMSKEDIEVWHNECLREANKYFKKLYIMGKDTDINKIQEEIIKDINIEYEHYRLMTKDTNMLMILFTIIYELIKKIISNFKQMDTMVRNIVMYFFMSIIFIYFIASILQLSFGNIMTELFKYLIVSISAIFLYKSNR